MAVGSQVFYGLRVILRYKRVDLRDAVKVAAILDDRGYPEAAAWVAENPADYLRGLSTGFSVRGAVYLLHFVDQRGQSAPYKHARHYVGWAPEDRLPARIAEHKLGRGARLTQVIVAAGLTFTVERVWEGQDRHFERFIKNQRSTPAHCPRCRAERRAARRAARLAVAA